jgi:transcriptional regulator with XRE-family HTH domain
MARGRSADPVELLAEQLAADVSRLRLARQLSQAELARLCGTTQSAIARLERGARPPRLDTLARIATALDCSLDVELIPRTALPPGTGGPTP